MAVPRDAVAQLTELFGQTPEGFCALIDKLRCYGDGCQFPLEKLPGEERRQAPMQSGPAEPRNRRCVKTLRFCCKVGGVSQPKAEYAEALFRNFFPSSTLPPKFGIEHRAGIAVCLYHCDKSFTHDQDGLRGLLGVDMEAFRVAVAKVSAGISDFQNRYYKRKLYTRAKAKDRFPKQGQDSRLAREICGRDVTGRIRVEIYLDTD